MTPRQPIGVWQGKGSSHRESFPLPIGHLGVIYDSQPHGYTLFIAIQFRASASLKIYSNSEDFGPLKVTR
jgi:hypothetical protein